MSRGIPTFEQAYPARCERYVLPYKGAALERCRRPGKFEEEGKRWCFQHRPSLMGDRWKELEMARREDEQRALEVTWARSQAVAMLRIIREIAAGNLADPVLTCLEFLRVSGHPER